MKPPAFFATIGLVLALFVGGCTTRPASPISGPELYDTIFKGVKSPRPEIVHSYSEPYIPVSFGMERTKRIHEWAFEFVASRAWVDEVKASFMQPRFDQPRPPLPDWMAPDPEKFETLEMPFSSFASAHIYIEKSPADPERIRVFVHRH